MLYLRRLAPVYAPVGALAHAGSETKFVKFCGNRDKAVIELTSVYHLSLQRFISSHLTGCGAVALRPTTSVVHSRVQRTILSRFGMALLDVNSEVHRK